MPRPPPVTSTVRAEPAASLVIVAAASRIAVGAGLFLRLLVEDRLHGREALDEAIDRYWLGESQLRRKQMIHVQLFAGPAGALHVEPELQRNADREAREGDRAHQALAPRLDC